MPMQRCPNCQEWTSYLKGHQCSPKWYAWDEFDGSLAVADAIEVYADDAQEAAEKAAEAFDEGGGEGPNDQRIYVRLASEGEDEPAQLFEVSYEMNPSYHATEA